MVCLLDGSMLILIVFSLKIMEPENKNYVKIQRVTQINDK